MSILHAFEKSPDVIAKMTISAKDQVSSISQSSDRLSVGTIKWFGGLNGKTGRVNGFGFIVASGNEIFFHVSQAMSPVDSLTAETPVVFKHVKGKDGKPAAGAVWVLSRLSDEQLVALIKAEERMSPQDILAVVLHRQALVSCEAEVLAAIADLAALQPATLQLSKFWTRFTPGSPTDPLYEYAPDAVKRMVCVRHFSAFRLALDGLFEPLGEVGTAAGIAGVYAGLDAKDECIAELWASSKTDFELAKMLSARGAEKAVKGLYEAMGSQVEDIAITQLKGVSRDWTTHDLLVDGNVAIDVKNARRPVNGRSFYVEHTVPRFKLDRRGGGVRIAGLLSPYLQLEYLRAPGPTAAKFQVDDLVFLGETSRDDIDRLAAMFLSDTLEVTRGHERTVPNWVFGYPPACYRSFNEGLRRFIDDCEWPKGEEWRYVLDDAEQEKAIPALCLTGKPLPGAIASKLSEWQVDMYSKLQATTGNPPALPVIFLTILADFLDRVKRGDKDFSPQGYLPLLFPGEPDHDFASRRRGPTHGAASSNKRFELRQADTVSYPLGAIDPLNLVGTLIETLTTLWRGHKGADLARFSSYRFSGLGLLQAREKHRQDWTTLVAYCGGTVYGTDDAGDVRVTDDGEPLGMKGKCGHAPLVFGSCRTCDDCRKLICSECGFCSLPCQQKSFRALAATRRSRAIRRSAHGSSADFSSPAVAPPWQEVPWEAYKDDPLWR